MIHDNGLPPTLDIEFVPPLKAGAATFDKLSLREPRTGEVLLAEKHLARGMTVDNMRMSNITLICHVSGWPEIAVTALPVSAFNAAVAYLEGFIRSGLATGAS